MLIAYVMGYFFYTRRITEREVFPEKEDDPCLEGVAVSAVVLNEHEM